MNHCRKALFLLTRPLRDVTLLMVHGSCPYDISTHTPLTGRDGLLWLPLSSAAISTHTPLTGRDPAAVEVQFSTTISTHTPLTGRDRRIYLMIVALIDFYSHAPYGT